MRNTTFLKNFSFVEIDELVEEILVDEDNEDDL